MREAGAIQRTALSHQGAGRLLVDLYRACAKRFLSCNEPTYWYKPGAALKKDACFAAAPRPRVSKRPCLQKKLYFGSGFLSILFGCLILPKLASFDLHKFIYFTKMDGEAGEAENYT